MKNASTSTVGTTDDSRKPRSDGEQSRERLLLAAMRLFAEQGYAKTSTREIALAAGANVAAIRYYFGDKASLYRTLFRCRPDGAPQTAPWSALAGAPLRQALAAFYDDMLAQLKQGDLTRLFLRLWFRELLEPTGLWQEEIDLSIRPMHLALLALLARHVGLATPPADLESDADLHRLAYAVAGLGMQLMMARDVISAITPALIASAPAIDAWSARLVDYAEAMVNAERQRRTHQ